MFHENVHVPYQNLEINPCISSRKIVLNGTVEICLSGSVSDRIDFSDFHINYEQVQRKM